MGTPFSYPFCPEGGIQEQTVSQMTYSVGSEHWLSVQEKKTCCYLLGLHTPICVLWLLTTSSSILFKQSSFYNNALLWKKISVFIQRSAVFIHQWKYNVHMHASFPVKGSQERLNPTASDNHYLILPIISEIFTLLPHQAFLWSPR